MAVKSASFSLFSKLDFSWTFKIVSHREPVGTIHTISSLYVCVCAFTFVCLWVCNCIFVWRSAPPPLSLYLAVKARGQHQQLFHKLSPLISHTGSLLTWSLWTWSIFWHCLPKTRISRMYFQAWLSMCVLGSNPSLFACKESTLAIELSFIVQTSLSLHWLCSPALVLAVCDCTCGHVCGNI